MPGLCLMIGWCVRVSPWLERLDAHDAAAARLDRIAADDLIGRPVRALDQDVGWTRRMMSAGVSSSKIDDGVDAGERGQHFGALVLRVDRPRRALVPADGRVGVQPDDQESRRAPRAPGGSARGRDAGCRRRRW